MNEKKLHNLLKRLYNLKLCIGNITGVRYLNAIGSESISSHLKDTFDELEYIQNELQKELNINLSVIKEIDGHMEITEIKPY